VSRGKKARKASAARKKARQRAIALQVLRGERRPAPGVVYWLDDEHLRGVTARPLEPGRGR
jgi:hypothetical protein